MKMKTFLKYLNNRESNDWNKMKLIMAHKRELGKLNPTVQSIYIRELLTVTTHKITKQLVSGALSRV